MLKVLWVEDDKDNIEEYRDTSFDELFGEPIVPESFEKSCELTKNNLAYDFVIIDIDLNKFTDFNSDFSNNVKKEVSFEKFKNKEKLFSQVAGFVIYANLLEYGFPKERIIFLTANAGSQNNTYDEFESHFTQALMPLPEYLIKEGDAPGKLSEKLKLRINPYLTLRRGIIEGCRQLKKLKEKLRFDKFSKEDKKPAFLDIDDYLDVLENFLPLHEPCNKAALYKLFIRTLAHEWEESVEPKKIDDDQTTFAFSWIMKMTRNWMAHNSTAIFNNLTEQDIAYLFICNMRAIFDLGIKAKGYEKDLFLLFNKSEESESFKKSELDIKEQRIPLVKYYVSYFNQKTKKTQVHHILHDLQNDKSKLNAKGDDFFITGLYHSFWFLTSEHDDKKDKAAENNRNPNQVYISRHYTFHCFDYAKSDFLLKFSSHIYNRSFPQ